MKKIYFNGKILTMSHRNGEKAVEQAPKAVLVQDGVITGVGSEQEVFGLAPNALKYDLRGKCLMPSFIDAHSHFVMSGQMAFCADLSECESYEDIIYVLKCYIEKRQIGENQVVLGFGYDHNFLQEGSHPDRYILDQVSTKIPIFVLHVSAHLGCANSTALAFAHITSSTPDPAGGVIGRLAGSKEPSGYLEEAGVQLFLMAVASMVNVSGEEIMKRAQEAYLENGVTTAQDGASSKNEIQILKQMADSGMLLMDVVAYPMISGDGQEIIAENLQLFQKYKEHLKIGGYKLILDGSPQGRSAWLSEPYLGGEEGYCGYPWMSDAAVEKYVQSALSERRQILVHCNGDAASEQFLNAYEKAVNTTGIQDNLRPVMIHCQTVRNDQLERMARLHMIASIFVGHVWYWGDVHKKNLGTKRGDHISPVKDALELGVRVNFHQDTPVTKPNMLHSVWCAVNRLSRSGDVIGAEQKISVYDALRAVTIEAAYEYFEEDVKGTIEVGKRADLIVLDQSPLEVEPMKIKDIRVLETIKDGETVYAI